jgi:hypothetical protein
MRLIHKFTSRQDGLIEVIVTIINKEPKDYTYVIGSEFALNRFQFFSKRKLYGRALNVLKEFNIAEGRS